MTPEELCSALNHSWLCHESGYFCPVCSRSFPLGVWARRDEDEQYANLKNSCPHGSCDV